MPLINHRRFGKYGAQEPIKVGRLMVRKEMEVTQHYECAAWHQTIKVAPGIYDLLAWHSEDGHISTIGARVSGPITSACFQSRIGAHYGKDSGPETVGQPADGFVSVCAYGDVGDKTWESTGDVLVRLDPSVCDVETWMPKPLEGDTRPNREMWRVTVK